MFGRRCHSTWWNATDGRARGTCHIASVASPWPKTNSCIYYSIFARFLFVMRKQLTIDLSACIVGRTSDARNFQFFSFFPQFVDFPYFFFFSFHTNSHSKKTPPSSPSRAKQNVKWATRIVKQISLMIEICGKPRRRMQNISIRNVFHGDDESDNAWIPNKIPFFFKKQYSNFFYRKATHQCGWLICCYENYGKTRIRTTNGILICSFANCLLPYGTWHGEAMWESKLQETRTNHLNTHLPKRPKNLSINNEIWRRKQRGSKSTAIVMLVLAAHKNCDNISTDNNEHVAWAGNSQLRIIAESQSVCFVVQTRHNVQWTY